LERIAAILLGMTEGTELFRTRREGEQPLVEFACDQPVPIDTYSGRVHIDWDPDAAITPLGQMAFFIAFLKSAGLFDNLVAACPLHYGGISPNRRKFRLPTISAASSGYGWDR
jgi:hypothetical protein